MDENLHGSKEVGSDEEPRVAEATDERHLGRDTPNPPVDGRHHQHVPAGAVLPLDVGGPAFLDLFNLPRPMPCRMLIRRNPFAWKSNFNRNLCLDTTMSLHELA